MQGFKYTWDERSRRYRSSSGTYVSADDVRRAIDQAMKSEVKRLRAVAQQLIDREISLAEFDKEMRTAIKRTQIMGAAAAKGGFAQLTQTDYGRVGQIVRGQYKFLDTFIAQIKSGVQPRNGRIAARAAMYIQAGRTSFYQHLRAASSAAGLEEERSVLHPADHCVECVDMASFGWVDIGTLVPIGMRQCLSNCRCTMQFR